MGGLTFGKLFFAYNKTNKELNINEIARKQRHEAGRLEKELQIGDKVSIRNKALKGRDKIQDKWKAEVHGIVDKPYKSVYSVKPVKTVNRLELKPVNI